MAYARFSPPHSEVYVISTTSKHDVGWRWECLSCDILPAVRKEEVDLDFEAQVAIPTGHFYWAKDTFVAATPGQMLTHLQLHVLLGDAVPTNALVRLKSEENERVAKEKAHWDALAAGSMKEKP